MYVDEVKKEFFKHLPYSKANLASTLNPLLLAYDMYDNNLYLL